MTQASANVNIMIKAARKAARSLLRDFGEVENLQVSAKGPGDFVSRADIKAEQDLSDAFLEAGAPEVCLFNRTPERADAVARHYGARVKPFDWADRVEGHSIDCGHYLAEEAPEETLAALEPFLARAFMS